MGKRFRLVCDWCGATTPEVDEQSLRALIAPPPLDVDGAMTLDEAARRYRAPPNPYPPGWTMLSRRDVTPYMIGPSGGLGAFEDCLCPTCSDRLTRVRAAKVSELQ